MSDEAATTDKDTDTVSYLGLSDEEAMNQMPPEEDKTEDTDETEEQESELGQEDDSTDETTPTEPTDATDDDASAVEGDSAPAEADEDGNAAEESDSTDKSNETEKTSEKESKIDYKKEYEQLLSPFKANGKELQVKNVSEAVNLMQMGANYHKKMAALKPNLKIMKMLENNQLLDETKLSYLMDLDKKNPEAIKKLIKDSGLDPLEMDLEQESNYKPGSYAVHDKELDLDQVLEEIQDTSSYSRTLNIVSKEWDGPSKQIIAENPQLLTVINDHVANGIYDQIIKEVESERLFGRLKGISDIDAYKQVGDVIEARGGFTKPESKETGSKNTDKSIITPKPKQKADDPKLKDKKRAASSTKTAGPAPKQDFNPLSMSDEEFSKLNVNLM